MMDRQVENLLKIVKFAPPLVILITCIFITSLMYNEQKRELLDDHKLVEKQFIQDEKKRIKANISTVYNLIKYEDKNIEIELKKKLKYDIENVYKIMESIYKENINKKPKSQIIKEIKTALHTIRFNKGRTYIALANMDSVNVMQPLRPEREGVYVYDYQDSRGTYIMHEAFRIVNSSKQEGFLEYYFNKLDDSSKEYKKISYIKAFKELDLIIILGDYVRDFKLDIQKKVLDQISKLRYINEGYIFVINFDGKVLYHPSEKASGENIFKGNKFSHVSELFKNLISKEEKDASSFIRIKPKIVEGKETKEIKVTFSKRFDDWGWIISTSFKSSDAHNIIENRKVFLEKKYSGYKKDILLYGVIFTILLLIVSFFISKLLEKKFLNYKNSLENQIKENIEQKETLQKAQEVAHLGDWKLNLKTKKAFWSDEIVRIFGLTPSDKDKFGPEYLKSIMIEEDISCFDESINRCISEGTEHKCFYRIKKPDGDIRWIDCRGRIDKEKLFIIGTVQDITENRKLELEKKQKDELFYQQSKMAAMGEMLGNIAHQWRQPLSAISTAATGSMIQKEMDCLSDVQFKSAMTTINNSAQYLSQTIDDFRSFFNPKNNKSSSFTISTIIEKTLNLVDSQFTAKEIDIVKKVEDYELFSLENEVIQVLINILNNSRDALITKEGQKRFIFISTYKKDNTAYIEILDNAGGIKSDIIDRVFEPYFTTKHKAQGTGIGLYMSEEIIKNHLNGNILVKNETFEYEGNEYKGAKFIIEILV